MPRRSSSQRVIFSFISGLRNDDRGGPAALLRDESALERRERPRRRAADVAPGQVVLPAVAVARDAAFFFRVADDAVEVGAGGGEGAELGVTDFDEDDGLGAEADDFVTFLTEDRIVDRARLDLVGGRLGDVRRADVAQDRVDDGDAHGAEARPDKPIQETPARDRWTFHEGILPFGVVRVGSDAARLACEEAQIGVTCDTETLRHSDYR